jgi:hypothetical protein
MIAPTPNNAREVNVKSLRPRMPLSDPMMGIKTAPVIRKPVPAQKISIALPLTEVAMCDRATESEVASRAAIKTMMHIEVKAKPRRQVNRKGSSSLIDSVGEDATGEDAVREVLVSMMMSFYSTLEWFDGATTNGLESLDFMDGA